MSIAQEVRLQELEQRTKEQAERLAELERQIAELAENKNRTLSLSKEKSRG